MRTLTVSNRRYLTFRESGSFYLVRKKSELHKCDLSEYLLCGCYTIIVFNVNCSVFFKSGLYYIYLNAVICIENFACLTIMVFKCLPHFYACTRAENCSIKTALYMRVNGK